MRTDPVEIAWHCFRHFVHLDHSNAAIHCAPVRYSPITFRLAEMLNEMPVAVPVDDFSIKLLDQVVDALGKYEEDKGR